MSDESAKSDSSDTESRIYVRFTERYIIIHGYPHYVGNKRSNAIDLCEDRAIPERFPW